MCMYENIVSHITCAFRMSIYVYICACINIVSYRKFHVPHVLNVYVILYTHIHTQYLYTHACHILYLYTYSIHVYSVRQTLYIYTHVWNATSLYIYTRICHTFYIHTRVCHSPYIHTRCCHTQYVHVYAILYTYTIRISCVMQHVLNTYVRLYE